jgi:hypothetical protein
MACKICLGNDRDFAQATVLGKYLANYRRCSSCGFIHVDNPFWLAESYESAITGTDIGSVHRTGVNSLQTKAIIEFFFDKSARFLDYGAGYGMLVRKMRDIGYDFYAYDLHCQNIFSSQFQLGSIENRNFELITAFEIFEHLENPMDIVTDILRHTDSILFSTELVPANSPAPGEWWYYGLDHGQHISFFTRESLEHMAEKCGKKLLTNGATHLMTSKHVDRRAFKLATNQRLNRILDFFLNRPSLLQGDFEALLQKERK